MIRAVRVLGIDPGSRRCGYGVVARDGSRLRVVESGVLAPGDFAMPERLGLILAGLSDLIARCAPAEVAVEMVYAGISARSALVLGQARGVALAAAATAGLPVFEYAPSEVKLALAGNGRAEKAQMVRMAEALLGVRARLSDEADALALAVCHLGRRAALARAAPQARQAVDRGGGARESAVRASSRREAAALARLRPSRIPPAGRRRVVGDAS